MYEVSNIGRVRNKITGHIMAQFPSEKGYLMTIFRCSSGKSKSIKTHRVVAVHFVDGRTQSKCEVDHIDCDKNNNKASNLEWVTHLENIRRAYKNNIIPIMRGERHGNTSLTEEDVTTVSMLLAYYCGNCRKVRNVAFWFGIDMPLERIHDIKYKKTWTYISDDFFTRESISRIDEISNDEAYHICQVIINNEFDAEAAYEELKADGHKVDFDIVRNIRDGNAKNNIMWRLKRKAKLL